MTSRVVRTLVAIVVVGALVGTVGLVSAGMDGAPTGDTETSTMGAIAEQLTGDTVDQEDNDMREMVREHVSTHEPGEQHADHAQHHANHAGHHADHADHAQHHANHAGHHADHAQHYGGNGHC